MNVPLTPKELTARLKKDPSGAYLFYGEEAYTKAHALRSLRAAVLQDENDTFNHIKIDARDEGIIDIDSSIEALPVFAERKLVELHGFDISHMKAEEFSTFLSHFELLKDNPQTVLVLTSTPYELDPGLPKRPTKELTALSEMLTPVYFAHSGGAALEKWVIAHFSSEHIAVTSTHAARLIDKVGSDMFALSGEIEKLCAYIRAKGTSALTDDDIDAVTAGNVTIDTFDFSNAIGAADKAKALYILDDMQKRGEAPEKILSQISGVFCDLAKIRAVCDGGGSYMTAAEELKMNQYRAKRYYEKLNRFSAEKLTKAVALCAEADVKIKFTALDKYVILSRLICEAL